MNGKIVILKIVGCMLKKKKANSRSWLHIICKILWDQFLHWRTFWYSPHIGQKEMHLLFNKD